MNRHQSPHRPGNSDLTALRKRHERREVRRRLKGKAMRTRTQLLAGAGMLAAGIALVATVSADGGPDKTSVNWSDPVPCYKTVEQVLICELGSPAASPVASETPVPLPTIVPTVAPEPTTVIETIIELPSTGTGATAK